jgi:hypothetical protein
MPPAHKRSWRRAEAEARINILSKDSDQRTEGTSYSQDWKKSFGNRSLAVAALLDVKELRARGVERRIFHRSRRLRLYEN